MTFCFQITPPTFFPSVCCVTNLSPIYNSLNIIFIPSLKYRKTVVNTNFWRYCFSFHLIFIKRILYQFHFRNTFVNLPVSSFAFILTRFRWFLSDSRCFFTEFNFKVGKHRKSVWELNWLNDCWLFTVLFASFIILLYPCDILPSIIKTIAFLFEICIVQLFTRGWWCCQFAAFSKTIGYSGTRSWSNSWIFLILELIIIIIHIEDQRCKNGCN